MDIEEIMNSVTWEHLLFIFSLVFIVLFRAPMADLIRRIIKIDEKGITASPLPEAQREKVQTSAEAVQQLLDAVGNSIVINEQEEKIRDELKVKQLTVETDTARVLIKHLAGTQVLLAFERVHSSIFGSQIYLLKKLNELAGQGQSVEFVHNHIDHVKTLFPDQLAGWSYEQYWAFLYSHLLIVLKDEKFHITNFGVEYLTWLARNGRSENRPL